MNKKELLNVKNCFMATSMFTLITIICILCKLPEGICVLPIIFAATFLIYGIVAMVEKLEKKGFFKKELSAKNLFIATIVFALITLVLALCGIPRGLCIPSGCLAVACLFYGIVCMAENLEKT